MMSTEVMSHVIVFHDKSHKFISQEQYDLLMRASATENKSISTPKLGTIFFSAIAKIPTVDAYYEMYPDERPDYRKELKLEPREGYKSIEEQALADVSRRKLLARGLALYISQAEARGENPMNAKTILQSWKTKINA